MTTPNPTGFDLEAEARRLTVYYGAHSGVEIEDEFRRVLRAAFAAGLARAAEIARSMVVGGRAWNHDQQVAGEALLACAKAIEPGTEAARASHAEQEPDLATIQANAHGMGQESAIAEAIDACHAEARDCGCWERIIARLPKTGPNAVRRPDVASHSGDKAGPREQGCGRTCAFGVCTMFCDKSDQHTADSCRCCWHMTDVELDAAVRAAGGDPVQMDARTDAIIAEARRRRPDVASHSGGVIQIRAEGAATDAPTSVASGTTRPGAPPPPPEIPASPLPQGGALDVPALLAFIARRRETIGNIGAPDVSATAYRVALDDVREFVESSGRRVTLGALPLQHPNAGAPVPCETKRQP